jgi:hypothetical protein
MPMFLAIRLKLISGLLPLALKRGLKITGQRPSAPALLPMVAGQPL